MLIYDAMVCIIILFFFSRYCTVYYVVLSRCVLFFLVVFVLKWILASETRKTDW